MDGPTLLQASAEAESESSEGESQDGGDSEGDTDTTERIGDSDASAAEAQQESVASPFLPGTNIQYALDSTSLGWLKTCPRLYYYHMIEGYTGTTEGIHLRFGIEYHQALHDYEKCRAVGIEHDDAVHDTIRALLERIHDWKPAPTTDSERVKSKDNLVRTVIWYLDKFEDDPAQTVILDNGKPALEVSFRFELDWGPEAGEEVADGTTRIYSQPYILCGHLDRIVTFNDNVYVMDRKTTGSTPSAYYFNQFEPNNQMSLYTLASQVVLKSPIKGVIIDAAQIAVGFSRFTRAFTYRTKEQLDEWVGDLAYLLGQAEQYAKEGYWPMNDTACGLYGGCKFREICTKSPQVREKFLKANFKKQVWNPLIPR